jgi:toluene monooxygenase system ferredoxin subunit
MITVTLGTIDLILCNVQGQVFAYADSCPHLASRLSEGRFDGRLITCSAHEWVFDGRGGGGVNPAQACLRRYPTRVIGNQIYVEMHQPRS